MDYKPNLCRLVNSFLLNLYMKLCYCYQKRIFLQNIVLSPNYRPPSNCFSCIRTARISEQVEFSGGVQINGVLLYLFIYFVGMGRYQKCIWRSLMQNHTTSGILCSNAPQPNMDVSSQQNHNTSMG